MESASEHQALVVIYHHACRALCGEQAIDSLTGGDFPRLVRATGDLGWKANPGLDPPPSRRIGLRMIDPVT